MMRSALALALALERPDSCQARSLNCTTRPLAHGTNLAIMNAAPANRVPGRGVVGSAVLRRHPFPSRPDGARAVREGIWTAHTLELLDFDKVRALVAFRAACSLGKAASRGLEPSTDAAEIHDRLALVTEMVEALSAGLRPPFGGLHDIGPLATRAQKGGVLEAEELAETLRDHPRDRQPRPVDRPGRQSVPPLGRPAARCR